LRLLDAGLGFFTMYAFALCPSMILFLRIASVWFIEKFTFGLGRPIEEEIALVERESLLFTDS
jgi:hypothetical protein